MSSRNDDRAATIKGVITLKDGTTSEFSIVSDGGWQQWGADRHRLSRSVPIMDAMAAGLLEEGLTASDNGPGTDEDDDEEQQP